MCMAPGQGLTTPWVRNIDVKRNILSLRSFVASLKKISLKSDFIHVYSPMGRGRQPPGDKILFDVNRNVLSLHSFVTSLKNMFLKPVFIQFSS